MCAIVYQINAHALPCSNIAQLITSIFLLRTRQIAILEASLLGSILQNLLLMTGLSFVAGGVMYQEQYFGQQIAQTYCMLLLLAVMSLLVPTLAQLLGNSRSDEIIKMSRGTAIIIIMSYALYLIFATFTDRALFNIDRPAPGKLRKQYKHTVSVRSVNDSGEPVLKEIAVSGALATIGARASAHAGGEVNKDRILRLEQDDDDDRQPTAELNLLTALLTIIIATVLLTLHTSFATDSLQALMDSPTAPVSDTSTLR